MLSGRWGAGAREVSIERLMRTATEICGLQPDMELGVALSPGAIDTARGWREGLLGVPQGSIIRPGQRDLSGGWGKIEVVFEA